MKKDSNTTDRLVNTWVEGLLQSSNQLLALPLSNDFKSPWGVNIMSDFLSKEASITISEAQRRKHLTLPLMEKMAGMKVILKGVSSRENVLRQKILHWYGSLSLEDKKSLPRSSSYPNNIQFKSLGAEQYSWISQAYQYETVAALIDEIHEDLQNLGIIKANFKSVKERKRLIKDVKSHVLEWVLNVVNDNDIDALWQIQVSKADTPIRLNVSVNYLEDTLGISRNAASKHREFAYPLIQKMIEEGILLIPSGDYEVASVEARRRLLHWYRLLSLEEKSLLPIFGNKISLGKIHSNQCPITRSDLNFDIVKDAWDLIHQDLEKLGLLNANYKSVSERNHERAELLEVPRETIKERFNRLATLKLNSVLDFIEPSDLEPFIQIEQLFASQSNTVPSKSGKNNYRDACIRFIEFLSELYGTIPLRIMAVFDEHLLSRYRKYLQQKIMSREISSHHANTTLSSVRKALNRLTQVLDMGYIFFDINGFDTNRETDLKKPFTKDERFKILDAIEKGLDESRSSLIPYKKTGIGKNPLDKHGARIRGLSTLENAQWLFENPLKCNPVHHNTAKSPIERAFLKIIADSDKGLMEVYNEWGVIPMVSTDILIPYLLRLAQVTGFNADSLLSLDIDDYVDCYPATSRPCLRYWKERSDGYKEYHLDLFKAQLNWLTSTQAKSVKGIFQEVLLLTSSIRQNIEDDALKNRLFIYQSNSSKKHGRVSPILGNEGENAKALGDSLARFVDKYSLKNDKGEPLTLTISRFRPTFVSEMINSGVSLREIQLMLGHSSIQTTIRYLDSLDFNSISREKLNNKLKEIHQSTLDGQPEELTQKVESKNDAELVVTFHTPLAECKNIFDPPEFVKNLPSYTSGTPCSQYNKCLSCDNVIITAKNLPEIFAMKRDYTLLTEHTRVMDTPYGHVIKENLELIKGIIDPELSDFSIEELEDGRRLAEYVGATMLADGAI